MVTPSAPVNRKIAQIESVREGIAAFNDLVAAGVEIVFGQISSSKPTARFPERDVSISRVAGELLVDIGAANSVDQGILIFHERIGRDKPALRRTLARIDRRMGRLPKTTRTAGQRAYSAAVAGGLVVRDRKTGRIKALTPEGRRLVRNAGRKATVARDARQKARQGTALAKLKGIGGG